LDLPPHVIVNSINDPCVVHFKDTKHDENAPAHYYIVLLVPGDKGMVICIITSQLDKKINYYERVNKKAIAGLVHPDLHDLAFLNPNKRSIIDCNSAELLSKGQLNHRVDGSHGIKVAQREVSGGLVAKVKNAVLNSPVVKPNVKKALKVN